MSVQETDSNIVDALLMQGHIDVVDYEFACTISDIEPTPDTDDLKLWAALTSQWLQRGHVCLEADDDALAQLTVKTPGTSEPIALTMPDLKSLDRFACVGSPGTFAPMTRSGQRLYLTRYWQYETCILNGIKRRTTDLAPKDDHASPDVDPLQRFGTETLSVEQATAVRMAWQERFSIITGGPGTGKTATVVKMLCGLLEHNPDLRFAICAPTGKAAARLDESIGSQVAALACEDHVRDRLLDPNHRASTLHRLLGTRPNSPYFRHDKDTPLPFDLVVVDEASMVDVALMAKLMDALPDTGRLVLVGDKDQLASVEAGSVLGDLCAGVPDASITVLSINFRAKDAPGIVSFARTFTSPKGPSIEAMQNYTGDAYSDIEWSTRSSADSDYQHEIATLVRAAWAGLATADSAETAFLGFRQLQILAAVHEGPSGVTHLNKVAQDALGQPAHQLWYAGRPVMIAQNDYQLGLFNGDIGIAFRDADRYFVWFESASGDHRRIAVNRLPAHVSAYAITIHKSQGTEAERVLMILPDRDNPILTRELVYTGATRARQRLDVWASREILEAAITRQTHRISGLTMQLRSNDGA
ncbi:MAG: exodeoxyribonuclease V subunit alpha [Kiritimatiellae bacterium]|nr:exodeoxyribonuclease V subunit alpha [Kiritimatiellia bacterium]